MKRTLKFCAILFCAMLWSIPAGAQRQSRPMPESDGTVSKMDKAVPVMQKQAALSQEAIASFENTKMVPKMNRVDRLKIAGDVKNLSKDQQEEMVKAYMKETMHRPMRVGAKDGAQTVPSVFMGAGMYRTIRFEVAENMVKNLSYIANDMQTTVGYMYPGWGTWCEDHFEGWWYSRDEETGNIYNVGYYSYDPVSDAVKNYAMEMTDPVRLSLLAAYDPIGKQIYTIRNVYSGGVLESIKVFKGSPKTAQFTEVGTINADWTPVAMAIDQTGKMYVIGTDANLYTIDKTTLQATEIGATGIATDAYGQSAAIDYRTQTLYWAYVNGTGTEAGVATVNTTTGEATKINNKFVQFTCLSSVYYTNPSPAEVEDFELSYNSDEQKVMASFTVPSLDVNGDALNAAALDTVEIFVVGTSSLERVYAKQNPVPGEQLTAEIDATGKSGKLTYAIRVKNKANKYSEFAIENVIALNITLPYAYGFEDAESDLSVTVNASPASAAVRDNTEHHTGSYSMKFTSAFGAQMDMNMLNVEGIPVRKGATYKVSLYAKAAAEFAALFTLFDMNSETLDMAYVMDDWDEVTATYVAPAKGKMKFTMLGYDGTPIYIDDIKIEEILGSEVPAPLEVNSITAAADGSNKAIVNITLPSETMGGETLSKIDSIKLYLATNSQFSANLTSVVIKENLTPGATADFTVALPKAGNYYLTADIYNEVGACPYISGYFSASGDEYQKSPWIGSDMPTSVNVTAAPQTDGAVVLTWLAPVAPHDGYIGTVTYTVKDAAGTQLYSGTDLTFTTAALALGMHTFTFEMTNGIETKTRKVNTIAGIKEGMIYSNVSAAGTTEARVLNVSATADNSAFSQMLYPATNRAMYIDTLLLFATAPETGEATQDVKIYMGTTDQTAFGGSATAPAKDFVEKKDLTEVFAGTLRFKAGENMLKLPLSGFYYDGTKTLVIGIVKPMQAKTSFAAAAYVAVSEDNMLKFRIASTEIDFDTVASYNAYTGTPNGYAVSMVATPGAALKTLKVAVDSMGVSPLQDAIVTIVNKGGKNMNATVTTGADGSVAFAYMPQGTYNVKVQKAAYIASEQEVTIGETSPVEVSFSLIKAKEVNVSGTVADKGGNKLAGVAVKAAGLADFTATTDADGAFTLSGVYGPGEYTLSFEKGGMQALSQPFVLGEKDTTLAKSFEMAYEILAVSMASASVQENGSALVEWNTPSVATMVSWTPDFAQMRRFTIDNKTPFKYAQRFLPEDLAALKLGDRTKALSFGFVVGSKTAAYSIVLAADTTHEIYRAEVPADKLKVGEWCDIDIPAESAAIDVTKELWLIVEVSGDNQDYPCAATTTGTVAGKGNLMTYQNKWYPITELFTNGAGNVLIRLLTEDASTKAEPANGYRVYRGLLEDEFEDYALLTAQPVKEQTYTDAAYATLPFGQYKYAVVADWYGDDLSEPAYTGIVNKDMEFTVTFKMVSNAGSAEDAYVYMIDTARSRDYEAVADAQGVAVVSQKVWRDVYNYEVTLPCHQTVRGELNLTQDTVINVSLQETVLNPELSVEVNGKDVVMNYGVNLHNWFDDVEAYPDFAIDNIGDYILSEPVIKGAIKDVTWANADEPQSWIVLNPGKTTPAFTLPAHSGDKMFAAFYNAKGQNNDYLIRPVSKGGGVFIFYCRAYAASYPEAFEVVYSSTTADLSAFKSIQAYNKVSVTSWTPVVVEIPESAKYIGIRCTSNDAFLFVVDDLAYYTEDPANPTAYEIYLDGTKVKDAKVDELTYTFKDLAFGEHKVGVKAIYASGASELVEKTVKISAEAKAINLNVDVKESTAVLTWDIPAGFTPKSYQVFLGNEKVAENLTEKTYTFTGLKNGKYTAAVVAVYETGVSEKATVDFRISGVDVEDVLTWTQSYIYPNPCNGTFYLNAEAAGVAEVYSLTGKKVQHTVIPAAGTYAFDLQSAHGMYVVKFVADGKIRYFKVVVR